MNEQSHNRTTDHIFEEAIDGHKELIDRFQKSSLQVIREILDRLLNCFRNGGKVLLIGNGGSAADCQHIAGELVGRFKINRKPLPAISLATDTSVITCITNDYDNLTLFSRQVDALARNNDILWAFSTSGESPNIIKAVDIAKDRSIPVIAFTGRPDSTLEKRSDVSICSNTPNTARAQEIHQLAYHIICACIDRYYDETPSP